jgi:cell division control protein 6
LSIGEVAALSNPSLSVFSRKEVFSLSWLPDHILHRDEQIKALKEDLSDVFKCITPHNILVVCDYGTGKTLVVCSVAEQVEKGAISSNIKIKTVYINCNNNDTHTQILRGILSQFDSQKARTGFPTDQYQRWLAEFAADYSFVFLILDEFDKIVFNKDGDYEKLLYFLTRTVPNFVTIMLTNKVGLDSHLDSHLESRVRDTLRHKTIQFPDYAKGELIGILRERCKIGLVQNAYNISTVLKIADISFRNGLRARGVVDLPRIAGELADSNNAAFLEDRFIDEAVKTLFNRRSLSIIESLDPTSLVLLWFVMDARTAVASDLVYQRWAENVRQRGLGYSRSMFYIIVKRLSDLDLLLTITKGKGRGRGVAQYLQLNPNTSEDVIQFLTSLREETPPIIVNVTR